MIRSLLIFLFVNLISGCQPPLTDPKKNVFKDLSILCNEYDINKWSAIDKNLSVEEFNQLVEQSIKAKVSTTEIRGIVNEIANTEFLTNIYPDTKRKVEALTGKNWDCENLKRFYALKIRPRGAELENINAITITANGNYIFNGVVIDLKNINEAQSNLEKTNSTISKTIVTMRPGSSEDQLQKLFTVLSQLRATDVSVVSE